MPIHLILTYISLAVVLAVVLALVIYLLLIIIALRNASRNLYQLADGLVAIDKDTKPLEGKLGTINGALVQLLNGLLSVNAHLANIGKMLKLSP